MRFFAFLIAALCVALLLTAGALCMFALLQGQLVVFWVVLLLSGFSFTVAFEDSLWRLDE